jgi:hypothetical protein
MAITIATMGRLIKNFDMLLPGCLRGCDKRLGDDRHAGANPLDPLGNDALARLQSLIDDPKVAGTFARLNVPDNYLVVAADYSNLIDAL